MTTDTPEPDASFYDIGRDADRAAFLAAAKVYARDVADAHGLSVSVSDLEWEVSERAKRRAGAVKYREENPETVSLTWEYFQEHGWTATAAVVRHELVHVHLINERGDASHGDAFQEWADELRTTVECERFADPNYWVVCRSCGSELPRYRKSKLVKNPDAYRCSGCGGDLTTRRATPEDD